MVNGVEVETTLSLTSHVLAALSIAKGGVTGVSHSLPPVLLSYNGLCLLFLPLLPLVSTTNVCVI